MTKIYVPTITRWGVKYHFEKRDNTFYFVDQFGSAKPILSAIKDILFAIFM